MPEHVESGVCGCWGCLWETETRSGLADSVLLLTEDHSRLVSVEGVPERHTEVAMLVLLEQAKSPSGEGGGSSGSAAGAPADVSAVDLQQSMERGLAQWWRLYGRGVAPAAPGVDLASRVRAASGVADAMAWDAQAPGVEALADLFRSWVLSIRDLLEPPRTTPIDAPCPYCLQLEAEAGGPDEEGAASRCHALVAVWAGPRVDHVRCNLCASAWPRTQFLQLAQQLKPELLAALLNPEANVVR